MRRATLAILAGVALVVGVARASAAEDEGWTALFDGKTFDGWKKTAENPDSWVIQDGSLVCQGPRSHLFYDGPEAPFQDFEFKAQVMTTPGSNSGIYIHTQYQPEGWPAAGYEVQVNNTHSDPVKTGSLYGTVKVLEAPAKDNEWFEMHITVSGKQITVKVDGKTLVDYTEPADKQAEGGFKRVLGQGTFALQAHDPQSKVSFRKLRVKKLP